MKSNGYRNPTNKNQETPVTYETSEKLTPRVLALRARFPNYPEISLSCIPYGPKGKRCEYSLTFPEPRFIIVWP